MGALGTQAGLQRPVHGPSDTALSLPCVASAQEATRWLQNFLHLLSDLVFPVSSWCPLSHTQRPYTGPYAHRGLPSYSDPTVGSSQALPGSGPQSPGALRRCWSVLPPAGYGALEQSPSWPWGHRGEH